MTRSTKILTKIGSIAILLSSAATQAQDAPAVALDASWNTVCAGAQPGTIFFDRCQEIINAGPGSGDRRSAAAVGNNLGVVGAQGRGTTREDDQPAANGTSTRADFGAWSLMANARIGDRDRDGNDFENGFSEDARGLDVGLDYRINDRWSIGGLLLLDRADADFDGNAGTLDTDGRSLIFVANGAIGENWWMQAYLGQRDLEFDTARNIQYDIVLNAGTPDELGLSISDRATSATDAEQTVAGISIGRSIVRDAWTISPQFALDFADTDIDAYAEQSANGLAQRFGTQSVESQTARIGVQVARSISRGAGVLQPFAKLTWQHEFDNDARLLASSFVADANQSQINYATQAPDRNMGELSVGLVGVMAQGRSWTVSYRRLIGHEFLDDGQLSIGGRWEF